MSDITTENTDNSKTKGRKIFISVDEDTYAYLEEKAAEDDRPFQHFCKRLFREAIAELRERDRVAEDRGEGFTASAPS